MEEFEKLIPLRPRRQEIVSNGLIIRDHKPVLTQRNSAWYHWEPIHFAAYKVDYEELRSIITYLSGEKKNSLNALSIFSENALHILLAYGRKVDSFDVQLSNGWESRICHVVAEENDQVYMCAELLVTAGVDINHSNIWNETPIIIAIRYRQLRVIQLLLTQKDIDLDSSKDPLTGKSARDLLKEYEIFLDKIIYNTVSLSYELTLFAYLKEDNVEEFLRFNNELIGQYVNALDGVNPNGGTMLQVCLVKSFSHYKPEKKESNLMKTGMLKLFCSQSCGKYVEHLLNNGADVAVKTLFFGEKDVFQMAVHLSYYPFLALLLENKNCALTCEQIVNALNQVHSLDKVHSKHVVYLLVSKLEALASSGHCPKDVLNNILDLYLADSKNDYTQEICQILKLGASLVSSEKGKETVRLNKIFYSTLKEHLDECVEGKDMRYDSLIASNSETVAVHFLVHDDKKRDLLNHPVLVRFIHQKWLKTKKFFYTNLTFYVIFLMSLYWHVIDGQSAGFDRTSLAVFMTTLSVQTVKEITQLCLYKKRYFYDFSNYLEIVMIFCSFVNIVLDQLRFRAEHYFTAFTVATVMAILISTLNFILMLGQVPKFTKYMVVFSSTKYFLEYVLFYSIQFFSFAICFSILLAPEEPTTKDKTFSETVDNIFKNLFDTLIYFIGQYDGDITSPPRFPRFGRVVVAAFIFCMTIILNNLLVGLIVTDMDLIQKTSKLEREVKMVRYVVKLEQFIASLKQLCGCESFINRWCDTKAFGPDEAKTLNDCDGSGGLDGEDKECLKALKDNKVPRKNVLHELYKHIVKEIYADHRSAKDSRDIILKLNRLEERLGISKRP